MSRAMQCDLCHLGAYLTLKQERQTSKPITEIPGGESAILTHSRPSTSIKGLLRAKHEMRY